ncbi:MAG: hypothetical protein J0L70_06545 [Leptolyngbya sp. UWPOB_LEPTO1]|uniref:hypothetical protein n=1 Tax=Leptolyngbya sp. UWPOB_LEPTO1 TaxID=2815653 RepID=UPI001AC025FE|nr:hypothetical protein [Leptolyngbya sp. UWPOB_LEPTO1]MBN8560162.1 hypothetical protein [Leptolyngbya sp. UWPOB_LEPTO1]
MDRKLLVYSLAGLFTGRVATAFVTLALFKTAPQATLTTGASAQPQPTSSQSSPSGNAPSIMLGMMSCPEQHFIVMMIPHHEGRASLLRGEKA